MERVSDRDLSIEGGAASAGAAVAVSRSAAAEIAVIARAVVRMGFLLKRTATRRESRAALLGVSQLRQRSGRKGRMLALARLISGRFMNGRAATPRASAEREAVHLGARLEELDLESAFGDRSGLTDSWYVF